MHCQTRTGRFGLAGGDNALGGVATGVRLQGEGGRAIGPHPQGGTAIRQGG